MASFGENIKPSKKTLNIPDFEFEWHSINKLEFFLISFIIFIHKCKLCILWTWFRAKIRLTSQIIW